ncbi:universal stress protein [Corynebacterium heidelbergense]|uniref:Universal stress protein n=1 Tax=Corynebacterium heidelbergense TaxID=2055947 RepID=A0A364VAN6_9CORY|nr:universal stress protein [Corynebacterium heidelbergense]RAV33712.1 universal stress protein [Corynebacterium heidelbergense]WCZ35753.1 Universal stress protein family protein [Corynebacterium heidelbergense]
MPNTGQKSTGLIAFDGSAESRAAVVTAAGVLGVDEVFVLTAWEPLHNSHGSHGTRTAHGDLDEQQDPAYQEASATCADGVQLCTEHGLSAKPLLVKCATAVWTAIVDSAEEVNADVIITGTRALRGWKSLVQTSVSDSIVKNAGRPVLIVPPVGEETAT